MELLPRGVNAQLQQAKNNAKANQKKAFSEFASSLPREKIDRIGISASDQR